MFCDDECKNNVVDGNVEKEVTSAISLFGFRFPTVFTGFQVSGNLKKEINVGKRYNLSNLQMVKWNSNTADRFPEKGTWVSKFLRFRVFGVFFFFSFFFRFFRSRNR